MDTQAKASVRRKRRPCYFAWCGKPAKVLKHGMTHGTEEPFFCSYRHAAWWALNQIEEAEGGVEWCEPGRHYVTAIDGCDEHNQQKEEE